MAKYYEVYKALITASLFAGVYLSSVEKIYGSKWYIKMLKVTIVIPVTVVSTLLIGTIKYIFFDEADLGNKLFGWGMFVYCFYVAYTVISFYYYRNSFTKVFQLWDELFEGELYPEIKERFLAENRRRTNRWLKIFGGISSIGSLVYYLFMYTNPEKKVAHPSGIPYRNQSPDYELINTLDMLVTVYGFGSIVTCDTTMMVFLSLEEAELKYLRECLARIIDTLSVSTAGEVNLNEDGTVRPLELWQKQNVFQDVERKIRLWIFHHQQLLRFHQELEKLFSPIYTVKFLVFVSLICIVGFLGVTGKLSPMDGALTVVVCFSFYALFYVNATFADSIDNEAYWIIGEAFAKSWHLYPPKIKMALHFVAMRSHTPLQYKSFKIHPLSSRTFLRILSLAYSFFTCMIQLNRKRGGVTVVEL